MSKQYRDGKVEIMASAGIPSAPNKIWLDISQENTRGPVLKVFSNAWGKFKKVFPFTVAYDTNDGSTDEVLSITAKNIPADTDSLPIIDSTAQYVLKRTSWARIKTALKSYFDAIYTLKGQVAGINDQTGTSYTLVFSDTGKYIRCTNADPIALTIPLEEDVDFPVGTVITLEQGGDGAITVAGDTSVTVNALDDALTSAGLYSALQVIKTGADEWTCVGGTSL